MAGAESKPMWMDLVSEGGNRWRYGAGVVSGLCGAELCRHLKDLGLVRAVARH